MCVYYQASERWKEKARREYTLFKIGQWLRPSLEVAGADEALKQNMGRTEWEIIWQVKGGYLGGVLAIKLGFRKGNLDPL